METHIVEALRSSPEGQEAEQILRSCVHCGFCTATCPTYQELGDELDGPRGRIYQIKGMLETGEASRETQQHLDRCLTCLTCMTICPSGVEYDKLLEIGRSFAEARVRRPLKERLQRWGLAAIVPYSKRFQASYRLGQWLKPVLPETLRVKLREPVVPLESYTPKAQSRQMIVLEGCVQPVLTPATNVAARRVLERVGVELRSSSAAGCCGAVDQHMSRLAPARRQMRRNIDAWWPMIEAGAEAILTTASGCGAMLKRYGDYFRDDSEYAEKAQRIASLARDLSEVITVEDLQRIGSSAPKRIAYHSPCTLQHGQKLMGQVESLLQGAGFELLPVADAHSCCGSAGTYSVLQPELSQRLLKKRLAALQAHQPALIASANVGCQTHLQTSAQVPVVHWIELFDPDRQWD